ncbi:MAG TPA: HAMP domain-containing sensor histidine kinase [Thermomicrobiales bacterium]|nr:HAMP domain-containing sensor histidine kinase [Thermomicrobiales bacterium]
MRAIKWLVTLPWRVLRFPFRLYRRKISVQLIFSHVVVVILSIILLEAAIIGILIAVFQQFEDDAFTEYTIAEFASSAAVVLSADPAIAHLGDGTMSVEEHARLEAALTALASQESTEELDIQVGVNTDPPQTQLGLIDYALVTDRTGTIVASSNTSWAQAGEPVERVDLAIVGDVTRRVVERDGATAVNDVLYEIEAVDRVTVASYPLMANGEMVGVLTLQSDPIEIPAVAEFVAGIAVANGVILVAIGLPALIVSVPVGIWRARRLSMRLTDLADTATAMGEGDLSRRVVVRGHDEVARVSERFNDMVDRLQTTDQARKSFVANVSHELRTPVAIIQGNLERLIADAESSGDSPEERRTLDMLHRETLTLSRLIDDLFTMARIEETTLPLATTALRVSEVAAEVVDGIREVAWEQRRVSVESLVPADLPPVVADRTRLRQILGNLLYNALRHTPEGGLIVVNAEREDGMLRITVSDTGVGISEEELHRVFDRFYQVERAGRHAEGSGLGLSIVKQLVEAQGGTIGAESVAGQGTTFHFTLPLAQFRPAS